MRKAKREAVSEMPGAELYKLIDKAVKKTYDKERALFKNDVSEWAVAFQLAYYMRRSLSQEQLGEYSIDVEYNRATVNEVVMTKYIGYKKRARPDIIIHKRGASSLDDEDANVLWLELKRSCDTKTAKDRIGEDFDKLKLVTRKAEKGLESVAGYRFGLSLLMPNDEAGVEYRWFENGKESTRNFGGSVDSNGVGGCVR